jgi:hypothetical protein
VDEFCIHLIVGPTGCGLVGVMDEFWGDGKKSQI